MRKKLLFLFVMLFYSKAVWAHPHVFVDSSVNVIFDGDNITSIEQTWSFDEMFSMSIIDEFDADQDKVFSPDETEKLKSGAFENLRNYNFFNNIFFDKKKIENLEYSDFSAKINGENLIYTFKVNLKEPITPKTSKVSIGIYDTEFFVDVIYVEKNPVTITGNEACNYKIDEDGDNPIFMGTLKPKTIYLECQ
ncbi:MAG: DUF1007 family protein [Alphaproteobacteria bacterium]